MARVLQWPRRFSLMLVRPRSGSRSEVMPVIAVTALAVLLQGPVQDAQWEGPSQQVSLPAKLHIVT